MLGDHVRIQPCKRPHALRRGCIRCHYRVHWQLIYIANVYNLIRLFVTISIKRSIGIIRTSVWTRTNYRLSCCICRQLLFSIICRRVLSRNRWLPSFPCTLFWIVSSLSSHLHQFLIPTAHQVCCSHPHHRYCLCRNSCSVIMRVDSPFRSKK